MPYPLRRTDALGHVIGLHRACVDIALPLLPHGFGRHDGIVDFAALPETTELTSAFSGANR